MASNYPLISVIIRTKDRPALFQYAINSVLQQAYRPIELVVVNDGGADVSEIVKSIGDESFVVRYIHNEVSRGRTCAANQGLDTARGEYLIFLDDDDWFESDHLSLLAQELRKSKDGRVAYSGVRFCAAPEAETEHVFNSEFDPTKLMMENYIPIHAALFHRSLVVDEGCRLDESLEVFEDWDLWLQLACHTRFIHKDKVTAGYRSGGASGAGWGKDVQRVRNARVRLLQKWKGIWSGEQMDLALNWNKDVWVKQLEQSQSDSSKLYEAHQNLSKLHRDLIHNHKTLEQQHAHLIEAHQELGQMHSQLLESNQHLEQLHKDLIQAHQELDRAYRDLTDAHQLVISSTSWKVTKPLRYVGRLIR